MKKLTQMQMCLAKLLLAEKEEKLPTHTFIGEFAFNSYWHFLSFKGATRISEVYADLTHVLDRKKVQGKSGSRYYAYWIKPEYRNISKLLKAVPHNYKKVVIQFKKSLA